MGMQYRVVMIQSEEGFAVRCPILKGCHSQGTTQEEALGNIQIAIREWMDAEADEAKAFKIIEAEVAV